ncbi:hypothetical protein KGO06_02685 [Patescibacteria group bacterium]|nr:hypothetical protein [Patescibacteria group bacterium]
MFQELSKLFATPLRIKLVKLFALERGAYRAAAVASQLGAPRASVAAEISSLHRLGIVRRVRTPQGLEFVWNSDYAHALSLQQFIIAVTTPTDQVVQRSFKPLSPYLVVVAGTLADETRGAVDILIVTKRPQDPRIGKVVKRLEATTAVPIRYAVLEVGEYIARREGFDRMLRDIFDFRHRVIIGRA